MEQNNTENHSLVTEFWILFKRHGNVFHALILLFSIIIIIFNIIAIRNSPEFSIEYFGWIALMIVVIERVFNHLKKKANIIKGKNNINIVEATQEVVKQKNFWNYFSLIIFILNILLLILLFLYINNTSREGGYVLFAGLIIHLGVILPSIPFVILSVLNKERKANNIIAGFFLLPPILFYIFILFIKLIYS